MHIIQRATWRVKAPARPAFRPAFFTRRFFCHIREPDFNSSIITSLPSGMIPAIAAAVSPVGVGIGIDGSGSKPEPKQQHGDKTTPEWSATCLEPDGNLTDPVHLSIRTRRIMATWMGIISLSARHGRGVPLFCFEVSIAAWPHWGTPLLCVRAKNVGRRVRVRR